MRVFGFAACAFLVAFWAVGCKYAPAGAKPDPLDRNLYPRVVLTEDLRGAIVVSDVIEDEGSPLKVTVVLRSLTNSADRNVQYRFIYLDERGNPENVAPGWRSRRMPARSEVFIKSNAMDRDAVDWRMEIRSAR